MAKTVRNGVSINADKVRTLRFTHGGVALFERDVMPILGLKQDTPAGIMQILPGYWSRADIQTLAIRAALWHEDQSIDNDAAGAIIDAYVDKGGSIDDLGIAMQEALRMALDPSSLASWRKSLESLRKIQDMRQDAAQIEVDKTLKEAEEKLKSLTKPEKLTVSESSS